MAASQAPAHPAHTAVCLPKLPAPLRRGARSRKLVKGTLCGGERTAAATVAAVK